MPPRIERLWYERTRRRDVVAKRRSNMKNAFDSNNFYIPSTGEPAKRKRKLAADAVLLIFLCLLVLLALTTITFLKFGSGQVLIGDNAFAEESKNEDVFMSAQSSIYEPTSLYGIKDGEVVEYGFSDQLEVMKEDPVLSVFNYGVDYSYDPETGLLQMDYYDHDENGDIVFDDKGEPVILHYSDYWLNGSFQVVDFNLDEALGLDGSERNEDDVMQKIAANAAPDGEKTALAAASSTYAPGTTNAFSKNTSYTAASNLSNSASASGGNGQGCTAQCACYVNITGAQWKRWWSNGVMSARATWNVGGSGSSGYGRYYAVGWYGQSGIGYRSDNNYNTTGWRGTAGSSCSYYIYARGTSNSTGSCSGSSVSVQINSAYFYVQHTNGDDCKPTSESWTKTWSTNRPINNISITVTSPINFMNTYYLKVSTAANADTWSGNTGGASYNQASVTLKNSQSACYANCYISYKDQGNYSSSKTYTGAQLYIDNYRPDGGYGFRMTTNTTAPNASGADPIQTASNSDVTTGKYVAETSTTLYLWTAARDVAYNGNRSGASGIPSSSSNHAVGVWAYNDQSGDWVNLTRQGVYSGDYYWYRGSISADKANGRWYVYLRDSVGNSNTYVNGYWISAVDCSAPTITSSTISVNKSATKSNAGTYWTANATAWDSYNWGNAPLYCSIQFKDTTGCKVTNANVYKNNGINHVVISYTYLGKTYKMGTDSQHVSGANNNWGGVVGRYQTATDGNNRNVGQKPATGATLTATLYFYLPSDARNVTNITATAYDHVGHSSGEKTLTLPGDYKIDVVAPKVTKVQVSAGNTSSSYTKDNVTLTVVAQDYGNAANPTGYYTYNTAPNPTLSYAGNGSGVRRIFVYNVNPISNRAAAPLYVIDNCTAASAGGNVSSVTKTFTITYDSYRIAGSSNSDPWLYVVAEDWAGNRSDAYNGYCTNSTYGVNKSQNNTDSKSYTASYASAACSWAGYYRSPYAGTGNGFADDQTHIINNKYNLNGAKIPVYRDTYKPRIRVYTDASCSASSCIASTDGTNSTTAKYYYPWKKQDSETFYVVVVCGDSGGKLQKNDTQVGSAIAHYRTNGLTYTANNTTSTNYSAYATFSKYTVTVNDPGAKDQKIVFKGGSGLDSAEIIIKTRLDNKVPGIVLEGFSATSLSSGEIANYDYITASSLTSSWSKNALYAIFAITDEHSGLSTSPIKYGKDGTAQVQNAPEGGAKYVLTFTYSYTDSAGKTHTYTADKTNTFEYISVDSSQVSHAYAQVRLFSTNDMANIQNTGTSASRKFNSGTSTKPNWDVLCGTYLHYTFKIKDFIGNEATFKTKDSVAAKDASGFTTDLAYKVDPFPVSATVNTYSVPESKWSDNVSTVRSNMKAYSGAWTKDYILAQIIYKTGLSPVTAKFGWKQSGSTSAFEYNNAASVGVNKKDVTPNVETWFYLSPDTTKDIQAEIGITSDAGAEDTQQSMPPLSGSTQNRNIIFRQDKTPPTVVAAFLSFRSDVTTLTDTNILLYFDMKEVSKGKYNFYLNTVKSKAYDSSSTFIWTEKKTYLYLVVTDCFNGLNGSGVAQENLSETGSASVKADYWIRTGASTSSSGTLNRRTDRLVARNKVGAENAYQYLYRSSDGSTPYYGYDNTSDQSLCPIVVTDYLGNATTIGTLGNMSTAGTNPVTNASVKAYKMFPVVDAVMPSVELKSTNTIRYSSNTTSYNNSYMASVNGKNRLRGTEWDNSGNPKTYPGTSDPIIYFTSATLIQPNLSITCGISGYKLYLRKRDFMEKISTYETKLNVESSTFGGSDYIPSDYNYAANGWGQYLSSDNWSRSGNPVNTFTPSSSSVVVGTQTSAVSITGTAILSRFDVLVVTGTGRYYLLELGDVAIDDAPPIINKEMTFFTLLRDSADENSSGVVDFSTVDRIWHNTVDSEYTNGKVNAYFNVEDTGSGIGVIKTAADATAYGLKTLNGASKSLIGQDLVYIGSSVLEKLTVKNLPVWTIGGKATNVIYWSDLYSTAKVAATAVNGCYALTITKKAGGSITVQTNIEFGSLSSTTVSHNTTTATYYRYTAASSSSIKPVAADKLSSGPSDSRHVLLNAPTYAPKIDTNDVSASFNMYYYKADKGEAVDYTKGHVIYNDTDSSSGEKIYARSKVDVHLSFSFGVSGFGELIITRTNLSTNEKTNYSICLPKVEKDGTKCKVTFENSVGNTVYVSVGTYSSTNVLRIVSKQESGTTRYYWVVNGNEASSSASYALSGKYSSLATLIGNTAGYGLSVTSMDAGVTSVDLDFAIPAQSNKYQYNFSLKNGVTISSSMTEVEIPLSNGDVQYYPARTARNGVKKVYIDTDAPIIDVNSGSYKELANATSWNAIAKLLSVAVSDNYEMGKEEHGVIDDVELQYQRYDATLGWVNASAKMINNFKWASGQLDDNLYRPTDATWNKNNKVFDVTDFVYCEYNKPYTIVAYDMAGNRSSATFTPKVDGSEARITSLQYKVKSGSNWVTYVPGTWASDTVKIVGRATYGANASGYKLQVRYGNTDSFNNSNWITLTPNVGYTVTANTGRITDNFVEFTILLGSEVTAYYNFYELRVLTGAQYTEFYSNGATTNAEGDRLEMTRTRFTDAAGNQAAPTLENKRYWIGNVTYALTLQGAVEAADLPAPGRTTDTTKKGIKIDKVTPVIGGSVSSSGVDYGSGSDNTWTCNVNYVNESVIIRITSKQNASDSSLNYASGNIIFYTADVTAAKNDYAKWIAIVPDGNKGSMRKYANNSFSDIVAISSDFALTPITQAITKERYAASLTYTLSTSQPNTGFKFYIQSGAGLESSIYTVSGVKIDTNIPTVSVSAVDTYQVFTRNGELFCMTDADSFTSTNFQAKKYNAQTVGVPWTKKNSVILKIEIGNIGYSGASLQLKEELMGASGNYSLKKDFSEYINLSYEEYMAHKEATGFYVVYIAVSENGNRRMTVRMVENACKNGSPTEHKESARSEAYVKIDNTTPFLSVKSISAKMEGLDGKADNWQYAQSGDKWYVEEMAVVLKAGMIEKSGSVYVYNASAPYSDYTVYVNRASYVGDDGRTVTDDTWVPIDVEFYSGVNVTYTLSGLIERGKYKFKIVSGTGMEFEIGDYIYDNTAAREKISSVNYNGEALTETSLQRKLGMVAGHTLDGDDDGSLNYEFNVDTNRYNYTYKAQLLTVWKEAELERQYNTNTGDLVEYVVKKGDWSNENGGSFSTVSPDMKFKHGDRIRVEYDSKSYTFEGFAGSFAYYHNYTEIQNKTATRTGENRIISNNETTMFEDSGRFDVTFGKYNLTMVADYGAELPVTYGATTFFIQYNNKPTATTGSVTYSWKQGSTTLKPNPMPALSYKYYELGLNGGNKVYTGVAATSIRTVDGNSNYFDVGAYYVVPSIPLYDVITGISVGTAITGTNVYVYDQNTDSYVRPQENTYLSNITYYKRNNVGNFRVAVLDGGAEERQEFVVKYFSEDTTIPIVANNAGYYTISDLTDFSYIDKDYYSYNKSTDVVTKCSYLKETNNKIYKLMTDFTLTKTTFSGFSGSFLAELDGNEKTITLALNNTVLSESFGIFNDFAGTVYNLNIVAGEVSVYLTGDEEIDIGLFARTMSGGSISNVSVTADYLIRQTVGHTAESYIGGIAAKAQNATLGGEKAVFTDIRVKNNGAELKNVHIGGMFGQTEGVNFNYAIAFGDVTVYNATDTDIGIAVAKGSVGANSGLFYFMKNTFLNDETVNSIGTDFNASFGTGVKYDDLIGLVTGEEVTVALGAVDVAGKLVRNRILDRLYSDFGFSTQVGYTNGFGTVDNPLQISTVENLTEMNEYVNLSYKLMNDIPDLTGYAPIAIHKVFNGSIDGATGNDSSYYVLGGFGNEITAYSAPYFGFIGQLNGTIKNLVFNKFNIKLTYTGTTPLHAGIVAGKANSNANINNVIVIGLTGVTSSSAEVFVGGIVGSANGSNLYDIVNMNNISVTASRIKAGGIVGKAGDGNSAVSLARSAGRIFSFGRVETSAIGNAMVEAGAILGAGTMKAFVVSPSVYGILDNTYILGVVASDKAIGNGTSDGNAPRMVKFTDATMRSSGFSTGKSPFTLLFGMNNGWYPLEGEGLASNPFKITSEEDFKNINLALYACYQITKDINFTSFETIGDGLNFTGTIDGTGEAGIGAEESNIVTLKNVTKPLVYNIMGTVQNLGINVNYSHVIQTNEVLYYGAVAVKMMNGGNVKNITIDGFVNITGVDMSTTAYVSGFVAVVSGGTIDNSAISDHTKLRNNISALDINIKGVGTVYVGGYAASVEQGGATFSFGIANGSITIEDCENAVVVGFLVGRSAGECDWNMALSSDYFYDIDIITHENGIRIVTTLEKPSDDDDEDRKNLIGNQ